MYIDFNVINVIVLDVTLRGARLLYLTMVLATLEVLEAAGGRIMILLSSQQISSHVSGGRSSTLEKGMV